MRTPDALTNLLTAYLDPWLRGETELRVERLTDALCAIHRRLSPHAQAERDAARRWLTPQAQDFMAREIHLAGGREISFILTPVGERYGNPRVSVRGHATRTSVYHGDLAPGVLTLHPHLEDLAPSDADLEGFSYRIDRTGGTGGDGIISHDATRLYLLRDPRPGEAS